MLEYKFDIIYVNSRRWFLYFICREDPKNCYSFLVKMLTFTSGKGNRFHIKTWLTAFSPQNYFLFPSFSSFFLPIYFFLHRPSKSIKRFDPPFCDFHWITFCWNNLMYYVRVHFWFKRCNIDSLYLFSLFFFSPFPFRERGK